MRKLTLDETWDLCLQMWKWVSRQCLGKDCEEFDVDELIENKFRDTKTEKQVIAYLLRRNHIYHKMP